LKPITKVAGNTKTDDVPWALKLFVASGSSASATAILQANYIVSEHLPKGSTLRIIDVSRELDAAALEQVLAIPTLVRAKPEPTRRIIGDLSDAQKVLILLGVIRQ
jgi:circadian clock protein KaiB